MPSFICTACGTGYPSSDHPPPQCTVCEDERQYVPLTGQGWTTLDSSQRSHNNAFRQYEPGLIGIGTEPRFAIGQRAILVITPEGNVLWDCVSLIDQATVTLINALGGLKAIAISHPHFYTTMSQWSRAFGDAPVHIHADDSEWVQNPFDSISQWAGETLEILPGVTLIRCGGHFPGASVLHWAGGAGGRGVVCSGDTVTVAMDRKQLTFMCSYPNFIPLSAETIRRIDRALEPFPIEALYGHYFDRVIEAEAKSVLKLSVKRYLEAIGDQ